MSDWTYKSWYRENKKALSKRRKKKYRQDAAYRKKCKKRALDYYHSHKKMEPVDRFKVKSSGNQVYFTIGRVARAINRKVGRVRELHQSGIIPEPLYFDKRGWRLYTFHHLELLKTAFSKLEVGEWNLEDIKKFLEKNWESENGKKHKGKTDR